MMLLMPHILAWRHHLQPCQSKTRQQHWVGRGSGVTVLVRQVSKIRLQLLFSVIYWHNRYDEENFSPRCVIWVDSNVTRRDPSLVTAFRVHQQPRPPFLSRFERGRADSAHHCPSLARNASWRVFSAMSTLSLTRNTRESSFCPPLPLPRSKCELEGVSCHAYPSSLISSEGELVLPTTAPPRSKRESEGVSCHAYPSSLVSSEGGLILPTTAPPSLETRVSHQILANTPTPPPRRVWLPITHPPPLRLTLDIHIRCDEGGYTSHRIHNPSLLPLTN